MESLYRTHDVPDEEKIRKLGTFINNFGYNLHVRKDESSDAYESICVIDVSQYSWDTSGGMHSESKICNFSIKDDTGEFQDYNLPKEMIDEIMPLITRPNVE